MPGDLLKPGFVRTYRGFQSQISQSCHAWTLPSFVPNVRLRQRDRISVAVHQFSSRHNYRHFTVNCWHVQLQREKVSSSDVKNIEKSSPFMLHNKHWQVFLPLLCHETEFNSSSPPSRPAFSGQKQEGMYSRFRQIGPTKGTEGGAWFLFKVSYTNLTWALWMLHFLLLV